MARDHLWHICDRDINLEVGKIAERGNVTKQPLSADPMLTQLLIACRMLIAAQGH